MASQAPNTATLPLLYNGLEPLNANLHAGRKLKRLEAIPQAAKAHAIPITVDEFFQVQRHFPIIFATGDSPVPLMLMGLNEGVNTYVSDDGTPIDDNVYMPAYLRRYPFLLARLRPDSDELSLCFDPTAGGVVEGEEGDALFDGTEPSEVTKEILGFCEAFEAAGQRTNAFAEELNKTGLLIDGEFAIQVDGADQPFVYRGFRMIDEEKLRDLRGDELRKLNQSGMLPLLFAHLISMGQIRELFARQIAQGKGPIAAPQPNGSGKPAKKAAAKAEA